MNQNLSDYTFVYVGCGGTFYAATPYLAVLAQRYDLVYTVYIDPDKVNTDDVSRQWPKWGKGRKVNAAKASIGIPGLCVWERFQDSIKSLEEELGDDLIEEGPWGDVLAIVNVDNNEARLAVATWLSQRVGSNIMVVSGCERTYGQCYSGVWVDKKAVCDWRESHKDVTPGETEETPRCQVQNIRANAMTGVCVGMCIEDVEQFLKDPERGFLTEFYWDEESSGVRMWSSMVDCEEVRRENCYT